MSDDADARRVPGREHLPALTGLRFALAFWVLLHHLTGKGRMLEPWVEQLPAGVQSVIHGGYVAVGTFFVLSGFVLARSYASAVWDRKGLVRYVVARYARVYPVYLVSLVVLAPIMYEYLRTPDRDGRLALVANYGLVLQGWASLPVQWNTPAWSLSCELFFYACFPLLLVFVKNTQWPGLLAVSAAGFVVPVLLGHAGVPADWKPLFHLSDFLLGIAAAGVYAALDRRGILRGKGYWLYVPAAVALLAVVSARPAKAGLIYPFVNAMLLVGLALGGGAAAAALSTRGALLLGKASYSMYILHIPLLWWFKRTWFYTSGSIAPPLAGLMYIGGVIAVSAAVWHKVEEPANRKIRRWHDARAKLARAPQASSPAHP